MEPAQKRIFLVLLLITGVVFGLFIWPNAVASQDLEMVQAFEPDEAVVVPYIFQMIAPTGSLNQSLRSFIIFEYYYYGFPYFAVSAILLVPFQWLGQIGNIPLIMLVLRQIVSVLPMLIGLLVLVYLQDGFRSYRSPLLYLFLLSVPAVVQNNFWLHPDGITFLLVVLTILFLKRDDLRFGRNFLMASFMCGLATATKTIGAGFFLAVGMTLILGLILKKASWKPLVGMGSAFLILMAGTFLIANPFLFSHWARIEFLNILHKESGVLANGYGVVYARGLSEALPLVRQFFGSVMFLLLSLGVAIWGAWRGPHRLLQGIILAWFIPITVIVFNTIHFKFQYWLPAALPLFSSLVVLLPERLDRASLWRKSLWIQTIIFLVLVFQFGWFLNVDIQGYARRVDRANGNPNLLFCEKAVQVLAPLPNGPLHVYHDYRIYVPQKTGWVNTTSFDLLEYGYIQAEDFEVLLLTDQRIRDYLSPNLSGIDPHLFALNQQFYRDAKEGTISGYHLVFRDDYGLVFVRNDLYQQYY